MRFFPEIWCINVRGYLKFVYNVMNRTAKPDHQTGPCRRKPRLASPYHHVRSVFLLYISSITVVITSVLQQPIGPILKGKEIQREKWTEVN